MSDFVPRPRHDALARRRPSFVTWRETQPGDAAPIVSAIEEWWPGCHVVHGVCHQLLEHLGDLSLIVEDGGELVAESGAWNRESVAFHVRLGFTLGQGGDVVDGLSKHRDVTGLGFDCVRMARRLDGGDDA